MASEWLSSTYQQYKHDTKTFTTWLGQSAIDIGFDFCPAFIDEKRPKQKKKAQTQNTIKVTVANLLEQAEFLAQNETLAVLPLHIYDAAKRAVAARKQCRDWYRASFGTIGSEQGNAGHDYFIQVLEKVLDILKPIVASRPQPKCEKNRPQAPKNVFEFLDVEDCADDELPPLADLVLSRGQSATHHTPASGTHDTVDEDSKRLFRYYCAFQDFYNIRTHVQRLWKGYRDGTVDLITASMVSNVAICLMEEIDNTTLWGIIDGNVLSSMDAAGMFYLFSCHLRGFSEPYPAFTAVGPMSDISHWLCLHIKPDADLFLKKPTPSEEVMRKKYGNFDMEKDYAAMSRVEKRDFETIVLARIVPDAALAGVLDEDRHYMLPMRDRITDALSDQGQTKSEISSIWLCSALHILMDIHIILRGNITRPCKQMRVIAKLSKGIQKDQERFLNSPDIKPLQREEWLPDLDMMLQTLTQTSEDDDLLRVKYSLWGETAKKVHIVPDTPFSSNPILCGKYALFFYVHLQQYGMVSADRWWAIMPMAHLYNALKQSGVLTTTWPRMEKLIEIHSPEYIFFGGTPTTLGACHSKARLAKGLSADMRAANHRSTKVALTRPRRTFKQNLSPLIIALHDHVPVHRDNQKGLMAIINQLFHQSEKKNAKSLSKDIQSFPLLDFVEENVSADIEGLKFNYYALNQECIKMLILLHAEFRSRFLAGKLNGYNGKTGWYLIHVAEDILFIALAYAHGKPGTETKTLREAARIIEACLGKR